MGLKAYVRTNSVIHDATIDGKVVTTLCKRKYRTTDPGVFTAEEWQQLPAVSRHKRDCEKCLVVRETARIKKFQETGEREE